MGSGMFQDQNDVKINYNTEKDAEIVDKKGTRVKIARCILCNSRFQVSFTPSLMLHPKVCPKNYLFGGRVGVTDQEQLILPKEVEDFKESDSNNLELYKASQ